MKKKSLEQRLAAAGSRAQSALGLFEVAAANLEDAASVADQVANEADAEAARLEFIRSEALGSARKSRAQAVKIKEFIGE